MYVEKLNESVINNIAFDLLVERAHRQPNNPLTLVGVYNLENGYNCISFQIEFHEERSNTNKIINIIANDYELFINNNYSKTGTIVLHKHMSKVFRYCSEPEELNQV